MSDRTPVICKPFRTAVGRYGGMYVDITAARLAQRVIEALLETMCVGGGQGRAAVFERV